ncbi:MAG: PH domain-containing protein, partial [Armatimonadetes bacterium]|nr:PH domain-containing protein [Armatimonadota bacterium]
IPWKGMLNGWWLVSFLLVVPILIFAIVVWLKQRSIHYRITTERITITSGLFSRESEDIQLVRIEDVQYKQGFFQRMLGVGTLLLISTDKTQRDLFIYGVADPPAFKEKIWHLVRERRQGMVLMEQLNV